MLDRIIRFLSRLFWRLVPLRRRKLTPEGCAQGDPFEGVYLPERFEILDPCVSVTGRVRDDINDADDGDVTFGLYLPEDKMWMVNDVNRAHYDGALHIEIVPMDQPRVHTPKPGQIVKVTGPHVTDLPHGHNEIHPAYRVEVLPNSA